MSATRSTRPGDVPEEGAERGPEGGAGRRRRMGSWLEGAAPQVGAHPGARLGLPAEGSGALGRLGRRVVALGIDWGMAVVISAGFFGGDPWATLGVFAVQSTVLVGTLGHTIGHRILGLRVRALEGPQDQAPGLLRALARTVAICLVIPAVVWDADGRGLHDRLAGTVLVRR